MTGRDDRPGPPAASDAGPGTQDALDALYAALLDAHAGLSDAESEALNARLILLLMEEVGDTDRLQTLIARAAADRAR